MRCLTPCCLVREGLFRNWPEGGTKADNMSKISTRHQTWLHRFTKWFKKVVKRALRNAQVFQISFWIFRFFAEIFRLIRDHG